jgi:hypothetical protein
MNIKKRPTEWNAQTNLTTLIIPQKDEVGND